MNTPLEVFPETHDTYYTVAASRPEGERMLGQIATQSAREYMWTYDADIQLWRHYPTQHAEEYVAQQGTLMVTEMSLEVPRGLVHPLAPEMSVYHIHPTLPAETELSAVKKQLPSSDDIRHAVVSCHNGYDDTRIVTELGTTVVTAPIEPPVKYQYQSAEEAKTFSLEHTQIADWLDTEGKVGAIHKSTEYYTEHLDGLLQLHFNPHIA